MCTGPQHCSIHQNAAGPRAVCSAVSWPGDSPGAAVPVPPPLSLSLIVAQVVALQALAQVGHTAELLVVIVELVLGLPALDPLCRDSPVTHPGPRAGTARCHLPRQQQWVRVSGQLMASCIPCTSASVQAVSSCPSVCPSAPAVSHVPVPRSILCSCLSHVPVSVPLSTPCICLCLMSLFLSMSCVPVSCPSARAVTVTTSVPVSLRGPFARPAARVLTPLPRAPLCPSRCPRPRVAARFPRGGGRGGVSSRRYLGGR